MDPETVIQHEVIEKEKKEISSGNNSGIQKNDTDELICKAETETDIEHGRMDTMYKNTTNENLLYSTGNSTQCSLVTKWKGNPKKREYYVQLIHFDVQQKQTQHFKATIHQ